MIIENLVTNKKVSKIQVLVHLEENINNHFKTITK